MQVNESINELREICQITFHRWSKQPKGFLLIRKVSIYFTWVLLHLPLTANQITLLGIATGLFACVLFGLNSLVAGIIVLQFSILMDFCDGEVSRYRKQQSKDGTYLDKIYHFLLHPSIFAGITIGAYQKHPSTWIVVVGFINTISVFIFPITMYAKNLALWIHCRRLFDKLIGALEGGTKVQSLISDILIGESGNQAFSTDKNRLRKWSKHTNLDSILLGISRYWNFPYIFFIVTVGCIIQLFIPMVIIVDISFSPIELLLLFYVVTYPFLIIVFLSVNLGIRSTERGYDRFVHDLSLLLKKKYD